MRYRISELILGCILIAVCMGLMANCAAQNDRMTQLENDIAQLKQQITQLQQSEQEKKVLLTQLVERMDSLLQNITRSNAELTTDVSSLMQEIRALQGELESNAHKINLLMRRLNKLGGDTGDTGVYPGSSSGLPGEPDFAPSAGVPDVNTQQTEIQYNEEKLYQNSYRNYLSGEYTLAIDGFKRFLEAFPNSDFADNALYWTGECYYSQKQYRSALAEFYQLIQQYGSGDKVPAALLKIGICYLELQRPRLAKDTFEMLIQQYPTANESIHAREKLKFLE